MAEPYYIEVVEDTVTIWRVRYKYINNGTRYQRYKHYFSQDTAVSKAAWWMIFDKYPNARMKGHHRRPCSCDYYSNDPYDTRLRSFDCELHDPQTGYYRQLHDRLVRWLSAQ